MHHIMCMFSSIIHINNVKVVVLCRILHVKKLFLCIFGMWVDDYCEWVDDYCEHVSGSCVWSLIFVWDKG